VDTSKPFQPFGPSPITGSSLIIGSREIFQKKLLYAWVSLTWLTAPYAYASPTPPGPLPTVKVDFLREGQWKETSIPAASLGSTAGPANFSFIASLDLPVLDQADFGANEFYGTQSRQGFAKLRLDGDFGQAAYQSDLLKYLSKISKTDPGPQPVGPTASALSMGYIAGSELALNTSTANSYQKR